MRLFAFNALALAVLASTTMAQEPIKIIQAPAAGKPIASPSSYGLGYDIGMNLVSGGLKAEDISKDDLLTGLLDAMSGKEPSVETKDIQAAMELLGKKIMERTKKAAEMKLAESAKFLEENKKKDGVQTTDSGLQYKVITNGTGASPTAANTVSVHYEGKLTSGKIFDSSIKRGMPATFPVSGVIPGWTEALMRMKVGDKWQLFIPPGLAYGEQGSQGAIGPNEALIFEVELLEIK
jgi:FKBP-type peptidyl-prolyl cis-trans isomerase FklB